MMSSAAAETSDSEEAEIVEEDIVDEGDEEEGEEQRDVAYPSPMQVAPSTPGWAALAWRRSGQALWVVALSVQWLLVGVLQLVRPVRLLHRAYRRLESIAAVLRPSDGRRGKLLAWLRATSGCEVPTIAATWRDGTVLCAIVQSEVPGSCPAPDDCELHSSLQHGQELAAKYLGVSPAFSEEEASTQPLLTAALERRLVSYLVAVQRACSRLALSAGAGGSASAAPGAGDGSGGGVRDEGSDRRPSEGPAVVARGMGLVLAVQNRRAFFYLYLLRPPAISDGEDGDSDGSVGGCSFHVHVAGPAGDFGSAVIPLSGLTPAVTVTVSDADNANGANDDSAERHEPPVLGIPRHPALRASRPRSRFSLPAWTSPPHSDANIPVEFRPAPATPSSPAAAVCVSYIPRNAGPHQLSIIWRGRHVVGSPFRVCVDESDGRTTPPAEAPRRLGSADADAAPDASCRRRQRRVLLRVVDFVTEKKVLTEDGHFAEMTPAQQRLLWRSNTEDPSQTSAVLNRLLTDSCETPPPGEPSLLDEVRDSDSEPGATGSGRESADGSSDRDCRPDATEFSRDSADSSTRARRLHRSTNVRAASSEESEEQPVQDGNSGLQRQRYRRILGLCNLLLRQQQPRRQSLEILSAAEHLLNGRPVRISRDTDRLVRSAICTLKAGAQHDADRRPESAPASVRYGIEGCHGDTAGLNAISELDDGEPNGGLAGKGRTYFARSRCKDRAPLHIDANKPAENSNSKSVATDLSPSDHGNQSEVPETSKEGDLNETFHSGLPSNLIDGDTLEKQCADTLITDQKVDAALHIAANITPWSGGETSDKQDLTINGLKTGLEADEERLKGHSNTVQKQQLSQTTVQQCLNTTISFSISSFDERNKTRSVPNTSLQGIPSIVFPPQKESEVIFSESDLGSSRSNRWVTDDTSKYAGIVRDRIAVFESCTPPKSEAAVSEKVSMPESESKEPEGSMLTASEPEVPAVKKIHICVHYIKPEEHTAQDGVNENSDLSSYRTESPCAFVAAEESEEEEEGRKQTVCNCSESVKEVGQTEVVSMLDMHSTARLYEEPLHQPHEKSTRDAKPIKDHSTITENIQSNVPVSYVIDHTPELKNVKESIETSRLETEIHYPQKSILEQDTSEFSTIDPHTVVSQTDEERIIDEVFRIFSEDSESIPSLSPEVISFEESKSFQAQEIINVNYVEEGENSIAAIRMNDDNEPCHTILHPSPSANQEGTVNLEDSGELSSLAFSINSNIHGSCETQTPRIEDENHSSMIWSSVAQKDLTADSDVEILTEEDMDLLYQSSVLTDITVHTSADELFEELYESLHTEDETEGAEQGEKETALQSKVFKDPELSESTTANIGDHPINIPKILCESHENDQNGPFVCNTEHNENVNSITSNEGNTIGNHIHDDADKLDLDNNDSEEPITDHGDCKDHTQFFVCDGKVKESIVESQDTISNKSHLELLKDTSCVAETDTEKEIYFKDGDELHHEDLLQNEDVVNYSTLIDVEKSFIFNTKSNELDVSASNAEMIFPSDNNTDLTPGPRISELTDVSLDKISRLNVSTDAKSVPQNVSSKHFSHSEQGCNTAVGSSSMLESSHNKELENNGASDLRDETIATTDRASEQHLDEGRKVTEKDTEPGGEIHYLKKKELGASESMEEAQPTECTDALKINALPLKNFQEGEIWKESVTNSSEDFTDTYLISHNMLCNREKYISEQSTVDLTILTSKFDEKCTTYIHQESENGTPKRGVAHSENNKDCVINNEACETNHENPNYDVRSDNKAFESDVLPCTSFSAYHSNSDVSHTYVDDSEYSEYQMMSSSCEKQELHAENPREFDILKSNVSTEINVNYESPSVEITKEVDEQTQNTCLDNRENTNENVDLQFSLANTAVHNHQETELVMMEENTTENSKGILHQFKNFETTVKEGHQSEIRELTHESEEVKLWDQILEKQVSESKQNVMVVDGEVKEKEDEKQPTDVCKAETSLIGTLLEYNELKHVFNTDATPIALTDRTEYDKTIIIENNVNENIVINEIFVKEKLIEKNEIEANALRIKLVNNMIAGGENMTEEELTKDARDILGSKSEEVCVGIAVKDKVEEQTFGETMFEELETVATQECNLVSSSEEVEVSDTIILAEGARVTVSKEKKEGTGERSITGENIMSDAPSVAKEIEELQKVTIGDQEKLEKLCEENEKKIETANQLSEKETSNGKGKWDGNKEPFDEETKETESPLIISNALKEKQISILEEKETAMARIVSQEDVTINVLKGKEDTVLERGSMLQGEKYCIEIKPDNEEVAETGTTDQTATGEDALVEITSRNDFETNLLIIDDHEKIKRVDDSKQEESMEVSKVKIGKCEARKEDGLSINISESDSSRLTDAIPSLASIGDDDEEFHLWPSDVPLGSPPNRSGACTPVGKFDDSLVDFDSVIAAPSLEEALRQFEDGLERARLQNERATVDATNSESDNAGIAEGDGGRDNDGSSEDINGDNSTPEGQYNSAEEQRAGESMDSGYLSTDDLHNSLHRSPDISRCYSLSANKSSPPRRRVPSELPGKIRPFQKIVNNDVKGDRGESGHMGPAEREIWGYQDDSDDESEWREVDNVPVRYYPRVLSPVPPPLVPIAEEGEEGGAGHDRTKRVPSGSDENAGTVANDLISTDESSSSKDKVSATQVSRKPPFSSANKSPDSFDDSDNKSSDNASLADNERSASPSDDSRDMSPQQGLVNNITQDGSRSHFQEVDTIEQSTNVSMERKISVPIIVIEDADLIENLYNEFPPQIDRQVFSDSEVIVDKVKCKPRKRRLVYYDDTDINIRQSVTATVPHEDTSKKSGVVSEGHVEEIQPKDEKNTSASNTDTANTDTASADFALQETDVDVSSGVFSEGAELFPKTKDEHDAGSFDDTSSAEEALDSTQGEKLDVEMKHVQHSTESTSPDELNDKCANDALETMIHQNSQYSEKTIEEIGMSAVLNDESSEMKNNDSFSVQSSVFSDECLTTTSLDNICAGYENKNSSHETTTLEMLIEIDDTNVNTVSYPLVKSNVGAEENILETSHSSGTVEIQNTSISECTGTEEIKIEDSTALHAADDTIHSKTDTETTICGALIDLTEDISNTSESNRHLEIDKMDVPMTNESKISIYVIGATPTPDLFETDGERTKDPQSSINTHSEHSKQEIDTVVPNQSELEKITDIRSESQSEPDANGDLSPSEVSASDARMESSEGTSEGSTLQAVPVVSRRPSSAAQKKVSHWKQWWDVRVNYQKKREREGGVRRKRKSPSIRIPGIVSRWRRSFETTAGAAAALEGGAGSAPGAAGGVASLGTPRASRIRQWRQYWDGLAAAEGAAAEGGTSSALRQRDTHRPLSKLRPDTIALFERGGDLEESPSLDESRGAFQQRWKSGYSAGANWRLQSPTPPPSYQELVQAGVISSPSKPQKPKRSRHYPYSGVAVSNTSVLSSSQASTPVPSPMIVEISAQKPAIKSPSPSPMIIGCYSSTESTLVTAQLSSEENRHQASESLDDTLMHKETERPSTATMEDRCDASAREKYDIDEQTPIIDTLVSTAAAQPNIDQFAVISHFSSTGQNLSCKTIPLVELAKDLTTEPVYIPIVGIDSVAQCTTEDSDSFYVSSLCVGEEAGVTVVRSRSNSIHSVESIPEVRVPERSIVSKLVKDTSVKETRKNIADERKDHIATRYIAAIGAKEQTIPVQRVSNFQDVNSVDCSTDKPRKFSDKGLDSNPLAVNSKHDMPVRTNEVNRYTVKNVVIVPREEESTDSGSGETYKKKSIEIPVATAKSDRNRIITQVNTTAPNATNASNSASRADSPKIPFDKAHSTSNNNEKNSSPSASEKTKSIGANVPLGSQINSPFGIPALSLEEEAMKSLDPSQVLKTSKSDRRSKEKVSLAEFLALEEQDFDSGELASVRKLSGLFDDKRAATPTHPLTPVAAPIPVAKPPTPPRTPTRRNAPRGKRPKDPELQQAEDIKPSSAEESPVRHATTAGGTQQPAPAVKPVVDTRRRPTTPSRMTPPIQVREASPDRATATGDGGGSEDAESRNRFEKARTFFQSLEKSTNRSGSLDSMPPSSRHTFNSSTESEDPTGATKPRGHRRRRRSADRRAVSVRSEPTSEVESLSVCGGARWQSRLAERPGGSERLPRKVSERFHVRDLFRDVLGDGGVRGIPHQQAVLAALRSVESDGSRPVSPYEELAGSGGASSPDPDVEVEAQGAHVACRSRSGASSPVPQAYLPEYPYLPKTPAQQFRPRPALLLPTLIPRSELLKTE